MWIRRCSSSDGSPLIARTAHVLVWRDRFQWWIERYVYQPPTGAAHTLENALTLRQALGILRSQWVLILVAVALSMAAAALVIFRSPSEYSATSLIRIVWTTPENAAPLPPLDTSVGANDASARKAAQDAFEAAGGSGSVRAGGASDSSDPTLVRVTATDQDPERASAVADSYARGYVLSLSDQASSAIATLQDQRDSIAERVAELEAQVGARPGDVLARADLDAAVQSYRGLSDQIERASVLDTPAVPVGQTSVALVGAPPLRVSLLAGVVGLMAGVGIAFLRAQLDVRVRRSDDVSSLVEIPVLGEIPRGRTLQRSPSDGLPVVSDPQSPTSTAVRELRTALQVRLDRGGEGLPYVGRHRSTKTPIVVVTSPNPEDGRSFVTANLAASWALAGRWTIAIDGDLRSPHLGDFLPVESSDPESMTRPSPDITQSYDERSLGTLALTPLPTRVKGLQLVEGDRYLGSPIGAPPGQRDPADILAAAATADLVNEVSVLADVVVIDTPSALSVADASIWSSYADGVVLVVKQGRTSDESLLRAVQRLRMNGATILGIVLNG